MQVQYDNSGANNFLAALEASIQNTRNQKLLERQLANDAMSQQLQRAQINEYLQKQAKQDAVQKALESELQPRNMQSPVLKVTPQAPSYDLSNTIIPNYLRGRDTNSGMTDEGLQRLIQQEVGGFNPSTVAPAKQFFMEQPNNGMAQAYAQNRVQPTGEMINNSYKPTMSDAMQSDAVQAAIMRLDPVKYYEGEQTRQAAVQKLLQEHLMKQPQGIKDADGNIIGYTGSVSYIPREKTQETWSAPETMKVGGKTAVVQKSSTGQLKPVVQDTPKININTNSTPDLVESDARAIIQGNLAPSDISKRNGHDVKVRAKVRELSPNFNFNEANANAKYMKSDVMNRQYVNLEGVKQPIEELKVLGAQLENTQFKPFNKFVNTLKENTGNKEIVAYNAKRNSVIQELANAMRGAGISEGSINLELRNFDNAYSPQQIETAVNNTLEVIKAKQQAIRQKPYGGNTPSAPKAGDIVKGYKFKGGNPADRNNWVKQ